jgi:hypothetical protein
MKRKKEIGLKAMWTSRGILATTQKEGLPRQGIAHRSSLTERIHRRKSQQRIKIEELSDNFWQKSAFEGQFTYYMKNSKVC